MVELRTPKGTLDYSPEDTRKMEHIKGILQDVFEKHGGRPLTTPIFELRSVLTNKYGDESKLIYNLEDQGGDICSLRYDLTVPFARYLAMNRVHKMRRYTIGDVFRRDNPSFKTGRLRQFTQADFDICGPGVPALHDSEVLAMLSEILSRLCPDKKFEIRINDRRILSGILELSAIPQSLHQSVCSTIDKLDKQSWGDLEAEFFQKGLSKVQIESMRDFISIKGTNESIINFLKEKSSAAYEEGFTEAICEIEKLLEYSSALGASNIRLDTSLARGLDYYTGMILEASYLGTDLGSVAGGGRYDGLCSSFGGPFVPCVGFSVGVSRLFSLVVCSEPRKGVFVSAAPGVSPDRRMALLRILWDKGIRAVTFSGRRANIPDHLKVADKEKFALAIILPLPKELDEDACVTVVDLETRKRCTCSEPDTIHFITNFLNQKADGDNDSDLGIWTTFE